MGVSFPFPLICAGVVESSACLKTKRDSVDTDPGSSMIPCLQADLYWRSQDKEPGPTPAPSEPPTVPRESDERAQPDANITRPKALSMQQTGSPGHSRITSLEDEEIVDQQAHIDRKRNEKKPSDLGVER